LRTRLVPLPRLVQLAAILLAIVTLARPVRRTEVAVATEGIDVLLCLDVSSSMNETDLDPARTRLDVAREAALRFVSERPGDRIGLVCFARYPDLRCPLTLDHGALARIVSAVATVPADSPEDATGIGAATALAARVLQGKHARSKVAIVLTDGEENVATPQTPAEIAPLHAAQLCHELGVRVYAIAAGLDAAVPPRRAPTDPGQVRRMAARTGGAFFEARDARSLEEVYARIDALEAAPIAGSRTETEERFAPFLAIAIALFLSGRLLEATVLGVAP
jgi:Ca-activated chloride channel family protein